jgi:serine/threonine-protein kinase HipA
VLPVYYEDQLVGEVEESGSGLSFAYARSWIDAADAFAISLTMPLREEPFAPEIGTPWFANLLPEDRVLEQVGRLLGRSQGDVYGLLEEIGREAAGALSIGEPEPADLVAYRDLDDPELADVIARLPGRPLLAGEPDVTMSLAGAQTKLAVAIFDGKISLPLRGAASTHILKPESDRLYATVENELFCLRLAEKIGLPVSPAVMRRVEGRRFLLVQRYDRHIVSPRRVRRVHQEDFCQALGRFPTQKYEARRGPKLADLFRLVKQRSHRAARDRLTLLDLTILACCIGDTDRHAKNFSLILNRPGPVLAPGYDLMSALAYDGITRNLAMKIADSSRAEHLQQRHWQRFAREVGLSAAATVRRVEQLAGMVAEHAEPVANELATSYPADERALRLFAAAIRERSKRVAANSRRGPRDDLESSADVDEPDSAS